MRLVEAYLKGIAVDQVVSTGGQCDAALHFDLGFAEVERIILELGLCPARYQRNRQTISCAGQLALLGSRVAVIGCGGLGGYVVEQLARLGVGELVAIDPDVFEEHNLNRQILATLVNLGQPKVEAAARRVAEINPAVRVLAHQCAFGPENALDLLAGTTVVVDALDNIATRFQLLEACRSLGIPLVHGAIAGWYGQVAVQRPGEDISGFLSSAWQEPKGVETKLGNPAFTPAVVASLQVAETCKLIIAPGQREGRSLLVCNLLDMEFDQIRL